MTLTLRIDNYDVLPDGGPTSVTVDSHNLSVGRSTSNDWTLPDPERHISSHHFDVEYRDGGYWLKDTSTNGVFLAGQRHRIDGAHQLRDGERFQVGHYYVTVSVTGGKAAPTGFTPTAAAAPVAAPPAPAAPAIDDNDPWSMGGPAAPIDPNPPGPASDPFADFSGEFIVNPSATPPAAPPPPAAPAATPGSASPFGGGPATPGFGAMPTPPAPAAAAAPAAATPAPGAGGADVIRAFCEGAGLPADAYLTADPTALARELGRTMQATAAELMAMLQDRASAKKFTKGGERTMMGNTENNPLKFLPDAAQALEVMFLAPRPGFMDGGKGVDSALKDVRTHQMAVFAAIQPALIQLLSDISPEAIEDTAGGGVLGGGKRKSWDTFVERWDKKVGSHENGMLDAFLAHFAEAYVAAVKKSG